MTEPVQCGKDRRIKEHDSKTYPAPWTNRPPLKWVLKTNGKAFVTATLIGTGIGIGFLALRAIADWPYDLAALAFTVASFIFALLVLYISRSIVFRLALTTEKIDEVKDDIGNVQETLNGMQQPPPDNPDSTSPTEPIPPSPPDDSPVSDTREGIPAETESIELSGMVPLAMVPPEALDYLFMDDRFREFLRGSELERGQLSICLEYDRYLVNRPPWSGWTLGVYGPQGRLGGIPIRYMDRYL